MASSSDNSHPKAQIGETTAATATMSKGRGIRVRKAKFGPVGVWFVWTRSSAQKEATGPIVFTPIQYDISDFYPVRQDWKKRRIQNSKAAIRRLPNELLLKIMKEVAKDPLDLYCLRQAAYLFADLFSDMTFEFYHRVYGNDKPPLTSWRFKPITRNKEGKFIWHKHGSYHPLGVGGKERAFRRLFSQDLCGFCDWNNRSGERKCRMFGLKKTKLYCQGCEVNHPRIVFSPEQRAMRRREDVEHHCIAHEGLIRLCAHYSFKASQIQDWVRSMRTADTGREVVLECRKCLTDLATSTFPISPLRDNTYQPRMVVSKANENTSKPSPTYQLHKLWEIPILRLSDSSRNSICLDAVKRELQETQTRYGDVACPHLRFNDGRLLGELACRDFSCFQRLEASTVTAKVRSRVAELPGEPRRGVIANYQAMCPLHAHHANCVCELPWEERQEYANYRDSSDEDKGMSFDKDREKLQNGVFHWPSHRVCCRLCNAEYRWIRRGNEFWISFRQRLPTCRTAPFTSHLKHGYDQHLINCMDPASYGDYQDEESIHITWCPKETCGNGKRGLIRHAMARERKGDLVPGESCCDRRARNNVDAAYAYLPLPR